MNLNLKRPLIVFDIESTGLDIVKDRIVEISLVKVLIDGSTEIKTRRINPDMPIPAATTAIHGIKDEDVKDCPTFKEIARNLASYMEGADLAGYNSFKFDLPILAEEFLRAGVDINLRKAKMIDVQNIYHKLEPRTLAAAYKFYCQKEIINAHSAEADTLATFEVLKAQLDRYPELQNEIGFLSEFSTRTKNVDFSGRIVKDEKDRSVFNFGKFKGRPVIEVFNTEPSYYGWLMNGDFTLDTKRVITEIRLNSMLGK